MTYLVFAVLFGCLSVTSIVLFFRKSVQRFQGVPKTLLFFGTLEGVSTALAVRFWLSPPIAELYAGSLLALGVFLLFFVIINAAVIHGVKHYS